ncbi:hypothetical protein [Pyrococcus sp. ST04]|uniref:hypothetical protein n=1 Tax=Pyrococcus sp. ST04 TaxID=1183377 RepID=UPI0002605974|nr:hypothetical protein [Pyrococcus sp. ST04]AFK21797.1 hypothetical protein Py04_0193 [Pyrococcus sp. ST04]
MRKSLKKRLGIVVVAVVMGLSTSAAIALAFNDILPIESITDFLGASLGFSIMYLGLGELLEYQLPPSKQPQGE